MRGLVIVTTDQEPKPKELRLLSTVTKTHIPTTTHRYLRSWCLPCCHTRRQDSDAPRRWGRTHVGGTGGRFLEAICVRHIAQKNVVARGTWFFGAPWPACGMRVAVRGGAKCCAYEPAWLPLAPPTLGVYLAVYSNFLAYGVAEMILGIWWILLGNSRG